jgi:hypothetical protein
MNVRRMSSWVLKQLMKQELLEKITTKAHGCEAAHGFEAYWNS